MCNNARELLAKELDRCDESLEAAYLRGYTEDGHSPSPISQAAIRVIERVLSTPSPAGADYLRRRTLGRLHTCLTDDAVPYWQRIINLFQRYDHRDPSTRLRDQLVILLDHALAAMSAYHTHMRSRAVTDAEVKAACKAIYGPEWAWEINEATMRCALEAARKVKS